MRVLVFVVAMLAGCTSTEEKAAHNEAQIRIIAVQREAQKAEKEAVAEAQKELYRSLLGVAQADPSQSGVVAMALAMQGMQGGGNKESSTPIVALQQQRNEALEWTQAIAPVAGGVLSTVGTAIITGNVQKRQIEATRDVQINQANQTANAIAAVAGLGSTAVAGAGDSYSGDYYSLADSTIDNSQTTTNTTTNTTTSTETNTETNTTTNTATSTTSSIADSYNTTSSVTDSYNTVDSSDNSTVDNSVSTITNDYSSVTYEGQEFTLESLLEYLRGTGLAYNLTIGDTTYSVEGDGEPTDVTCNDLTFGGSSCITGD